MKRNSFYTIIGFVCLAAFGVIGSCKKQTDIGELNNDLFVSISGSGNLARTMDLAIAGTNPLQNNVVRFGADLTKPSSKDIQAVVGVDTSKLDSYNTSNGTHYRLLPAAAYTLSAKTVTVKAGADHSSDSANLTITDISKLAAHVYMLPLKIISISGDNTAKLDTAVSTVYLRLTLTDVVQAYLSITGGANTGSEIGISSSNPVPVGLYAILNVPYSGGNVTAKIAADTSLAAGYNNANSTSYLVLPASAYQLTGAAVTISAGNLQSGDSVLFRITNAAALSNTQTYVLPVKITSFSGDPDADMGSNIVYIILSYSNIDASATPSGTAIDRTGWNISADVSNDAASAMLDGDYASSWISDGSANTYTITVDMGQSNTLTGLSYAPGYDYFQYGTDLAPQTIVVSTSSDGSAWSPQGTYNGAPTASGSSAASPDIKQFGFYQSVTARYFRFTITAEYISGFTGISELNAYH